jgi:6-phosphofructokinase 1
MLNNKKCIGVLTSGGDSPGMNAAIRAVVRTALARDIIPVGIYKGYNGLLEKKYKILEQSDVDNIIKQGGTILYTARCMEFYKAEYRETAYRNALEIGLDGLIVIGGDGSYRGAKELSDLGLMCIGIPGTIDNDIACTDYTIGYDTAMNTALEMIDRLNDTSASHNRCSVVEVMGRHAGHVALNVGIACGAVSVVTEEVPKNIDEIVNDIKKAIEEGKDHYIIVVSEGVGNCDKIAKEIQTLTNIDSRTTILGHVQRGGNPSVRDRVVANEMGNYAVDLLAKGIGKRVVAMRNDKIVDYDIQEALSKKKGLDMHLYNIMEEISA